MSDLQSMYAELRTAARRMLNREHYAHTLESTELVNQAFARLLHGDLRDKTLADPRGVIAAAVLHMRRELVDHARRRKAHKRPDPRRRVELDDVVAMSENDPATLLAVDALLDALAKDPSVRAGERRSTALRYALYAGMSEAEIGAMLDVPKSTIGADLRFARAWVAARLDAA